ncbi:hypothetical protein [Arcticibacter sp. MXS-1]|uniref:hypothetical protein n=1 Tax=Arcticibacter sp. MXS-1 TaxID=3341726 RepID=UPI0035A88532
MKDDRLSLKIAFNAEQFGCYNIVSFEEKAEPLFSKIFTDRNISYDQLGSVIEEERDKKYFQRFEYRTQKQEQALGYFLQNIFRKNRFRAGQESIINRALQGKDVIGLLPTGGGSP